MRVISFSVAKSTTETSSGRAVGREQICAIKRENVAPQAGAFTHGDGVQHLVGVRVQGRIPFQAQYGADVNFFPSGETLTVMGREPLGSVITFKSF